jgi:PAS domain S-box-containing protein
MDPYSEFIPEICNRLFPEAKVIFFFGEDTYRDILNKYPGRSSGIYIHKQYENSPALILRLLPRTKNIFVITGNSIVEQNDVKSIKEKLDAYSGRVNITYFTGMAVDEILKRVRGLPENSVIYFTTYLADPVEKWYLSSDVLSLILKESGSPVFGLFDQYMGEGIVGGELISSEASGEKVGEMAINLLNNNTSPDLKYIGAPSVKMFDWRQLQRWGISEKLLPPGSIIKYREYSFFEKYKWRIIFWVSLVILQFGLIAYLLITLVKRRHAEDALSSSERKYRRLIESTRDAIISIDRNKEIRTCNMGATEIFGYREEEMLGRSIMILAQEEERERQAENIKGVLESDSSLEYESMMVKRNGATIPVKINLSTLKNESEETIGLIQIIRDISEQKIAEEERKYLESALHQSQKMEAIGTLAGGIAHDFNNILTAIIGYTELAIFSGEKGTKEEANLHEVLKAGRRAKDLVNQILTFARKTHEEVKPILIGPIADDVLKLLRSTVPSSIEIRKKMESESLAMADRTRIHQVFLNLCTNAVQAMEKDGGILTVDIRDIYSNKNHGLMPGEYIKITISDTGTGIPRENLDLIFDPYFTTKKSGEGTGLGLSVVHGIVENYGGKINVESELNRGTVFTIFLPATKLRPVTEVNKYESLPGGSERILFIDDELCIVEMAGQLLGSLGYKVVCENSSMEALELFNERPMDFDLVITDMTMPHMNGDRLAAALIKIRSDIPVILCTGYSKSMTEETALRVGIKAFLMKPIEYSSLAKTVRDVLDS